MIVSHACKNISHFHTCFVLFISTLVTSSYLLIFCYKLYIVCADIYIYIYNIIIYIYIYIMLNILQCFCYLQINPVRRSTKKIRKRIFTKEFPQGRMTPYLSCGQTMTQTLVKIHSLYKVAKLLNVVQNNFWIKLLEC